MGRGRRRKSVGRVDNRQEGELRKGVDSRQKGELWKGGGAVR